MDAFGGIDILVNNASAIWLRGALDTPMKRFDLMQQVNSRGSFLCAQACLPHLLRAPNPHILTLAPPPSLQPKWWGPHTGYTLAKMGMSFVTLGLAAEFGPRGVAVNALWPKTCDRHRRDPHDPRGGAQLQDATPSSPMPRTQSSFARRAASAAIS